LTGSGGWATAEDEPKETPMNVPVSDPIIVPDELRACFERQRAAWLAAPAPTWRERRVDLDALARLL
jgi:coniferyl-aldehyde dehydrogenase